MYLNKKMTYKRKKENTFDWNWDFTTWFTPTEENPNPQGFIVTVGIGLNGNPNNYIGVSAGDFRYPMPTIGYDTRDGFGVGTNYNGNVSMYHPGVNYNAPYEAVDRAIDEARYLYNRTIIDNTPHALYHYYFGGGEDVLLGPNTINAVLNSPEFNYRHNRILTGQTKRSEGIFSVDLTWKIFHVGETRVDYQIRSRGNQSFVTYNLFVNDGFWDPNYLFEHIFPNNPRNKTDGMGPNLELWGSPYPYIQYRLIYRFPNPGYPW